MTEITSSHDGTKDGDHPVQSGATVAMMAREDHQPSGLNRFGPDYEPSSDEGHLDQDDRP